MKIPNMHAAIWTGKEFELRETKLYRDNSTVVKVLGSGVCATDRHLMELSDSGERSFGHEVLAEIVRIGDNLNSVGGHKLNVGDRVVVTPGVPCCECEICGTYAGHEHLCGSRKSHGFGRYSANKYFPTGGYSNYMELVDGLWVVKIDDDMTFDEAMFAEPVAIATKAVERGIGGSKQEFEIGAGVSMRAAVIGLGPIGCAATFVLKSIGAEVVGFDINEWKGSKVGSIFDFPTLAIPENPQEAREAIKAKYDLEYDLIIDSTGSPRGLELAILLARRGGRIVEVGAFAPGSSSFINPADICTKELEIVGSLMSPVYTYNKVLRLLRKFRQYDLTKLHTHTISLNNMNELLDIIHENKFIKVGIEV
ncbi:zinc-binding dehydrogenase [Paenibacillus sp.]|jgi:L-iditol 2-dehydrogenase|uniref:zinc-dependent alcohol dehydrogenase n=1 Tax=Paenibacillus sp. TaxID=58172 RepID=UPI002822A66E|nr:zinc-binding dehydrogenase [Paenibacillus sp.]MDR0270828.1 zinc-binding dehydrogenase [Paenibacillus sp.]